MPVGEPNFFAYVALFLWVPVTFVLYLRFKPTLATILTLLQTLRVMYGYVGDKAPYEVVVVEQLWYYNLGVMWSAYAAIVLFPNAWGGA